MRDDNMRKEKWLVQAKKADFNTLGERWNISPVTARIIRNRNHTTDEEFRIYLKGNESDMHSQ